MKSFLLLLVAIGVPAMANARSLTSAINITSGSQVDWYTCIAHGNYPDPTTCDHYIACTTALLAYQMPCAMGHNGQRLFYVPDSGPNEAESYCDYPQNVDCHLDGRTADTEAPTLPPTTSDSTPPESESSEENGGGDDGGHGGHCPSNVTEGGVCNHQIECWQCGDCDWYMRCDPATNRWVNATCDVHPDPDSTVRVDKKLFWFPGFNQHGGACVPWSALTEELRSEYINPVCKPVCEYRDDLGCPRRYFYSDPKLDNGEWFVPEKEQNCPEGTEWKQDILTCVLCPDGKNCSQGC